MDQTLPLQDAQQAQINDAENGCHSERCVEAKTNPVSLLVADGGQYTDGSKIYTDDQLVQALAKQRADAAAAAAPKRCGWDPSTWDGCAQNAEVWMYKHAVSSPLIVGAVQIASMIGCQATTLGVADCGSFSSADHAKELIAGFVTELVGTAAGVASMVKDNLQCVTGSLGACGHVLGDAASMGGGAAGGVVAEGAGLYHDVQSGHISAAVGGLLAQGLIMVATDGLGRAAGAVRGAIAGDAAASAGSSDLGELLGGCKLSFAPSTLVLLADGKTKPIGKLHVGDKVDAADPSTGKHAGGRTIEHVWINHDTDLLDVTVNDGHGHKSVIHTTANHPFWDDTTHTWLRADHLIPNHLLASRDGRHPTVVGVKVTPGAANRWNLTVQQLHTYYVVAGGVPILVHNSNGCPTGTALGPGGPALEGDPYSPDAVAARSAQNTAQYNSMVNANGDPYPQITDSRTGWPVSYPGDGFQVVPKADRVVWDKTARGAYIREWYDRGYGSLPGPWSDYDIHHILPREYGGSNDFSNLVPLLRQAEHQPFTSWWRNY